MHFPTIPSQWATLITDAILILWWLLVRIKLPSVRYRQWLYQSTVLLALWSILFWAVLPLTHAQNFTNYGSLGTYVELGLLFGLGGAIVATLAKWRLEPAIPQAIKLTWWRYGLSVIGILLAGWLSFSVIGTSLALSAILVLVTFLLAYTVLPRLYSGLVCAICAAIAVVLASAALTSWGALPQYWHIWGPILLGTTWQQVVLAAAVSFSLPAQLAWWLGQPILERHN